MTMTLKAPLIGEAEKAQYREEGYMILERAIPEDMLTMLREECHYYVGYQDGQMDAKQVKTQGITHRGSRYFIANQYRLSHRLWTFLFSDLMAEVATATVGPTAFLFHEQWVVKGPEQGMAFAWHQDSGYVKFRHPQVTHDPYVTVWCPLDDVNEANGTVYILPHSRAGTRNTIIDHRKDPVTNDLIGYEGSDPGIPVICPAGSIVAFSSFMLHRSGANTSSQIRRVYLPQYTAAPLLQPDGTNWAMAVPFLKDGRKIYDRSSDTAQRWGPPVRH